MAVVETAVDGNGKRVESYGLAEVPRVGGIVKGSKVLGFDFVKGGGIGKHMEEFSVAAMLLVEESTTTGLCLHGRVRTRA